MERPLFAEESESSQRATYCSVPLETRNTVDHQNCSGGCACFECDIWILARHAINSIDDCRRSWLLAQTQTRKIVVIGFTPWSAHATGSCTKCGGNSGLGLGDVQCSHVDAWLGAFLMIAAVVFSRFYLYRLEDMVYICSCQH